MIDCIRQRGFGWIELHRLLACGLPSPHQPSLLVIAADIEMTGSICDASRDRRAP
jgi:hypothetical protein